MEEKFEAPDTTAHRLADGSLYKIARTRTGLGASIVRTMAEHTRGMAGGVVSLAIGGRVISVRRSARVTMWYCKSNNTHAKAHAQMAIPIGRSLAGHFIRMVRIKAGLKTISCFCPVCCILCVESFHARSLKGLLVCRRLANDICCESSAMLHYRRGRLCLGCSVRRGGILCRRLHNFKWKEKNNNWNKQYHTYFIRKETINMIFCVYFVVVFFLSFAQFVESIKNEFR